MPIVFAPPDAIGTAAGQQAAIGYGTAIQGDKDRQFYLQAAALANQARGAVNQQSAVNAQLGASWTQAGNQQAALGQQANQFAQAQMDAQSRQNAQLQQAEQMQANVFSYQDSLRLQQQQQAWSGVDADPDLSPDEKQQAKAQIAPGMNYLQFKQQKAKQAEMQQQQQAEQQAGALQAAHVKAIGQLLTESPDGVKVYPDGSKLVYDGSKLHYEPPPKEAATPKGPDQEKLDEKWRDNYLKVEKHLETKDPVTLAIAPPSADQVAAKMKALGHGSTLDEDRQMRGAPARQPMPQPAQQNPTPPPPQNQGALEARKAVIMAKPIEQLTPEDKREIRDINTALQSANISQASQDGIIPRKQGEEQGLLHRLRSLNDYNPLLKMGMVPNLGPGGQ